MRVVSATERVWRQAGALPGPRVLVPTMGALHAGHVALIRRARQLAGKKGSVLVSIFVNPIQFGPREDLARYPRPRREDLAICRREGVALVFAPEPSTMYLPDHSTYIDESILSAGLCGATRPKHFRGVCTVVGKLFHLLQPHFAVFGEKDYQQLAIIRRMVRDLHFPVQIVSQPTVREADGLALSSRNRLLTPDERQAAPVIRRSLLQAAENFAKPRANLKKIVHTLRTQLEQAGGRVDYVEIVHAESLAPLIRAGKPAVIAVAVFFGNTRLIDNLQIV